MKNQFTLTNYDKNAEYYDQYRRPSAIIFERLKNLFNGTQGLILSIGCGTGRMEEALSENFPITGIDQSLGMLHKAHKRIRNRLQGDMTAMPFADNSFSGLYFMQSLHHVGANLEISPVSRVLARKQAIKEAIRVLHDGSLAIIQRDPSQNQAVWFWEYFPKALEVKLKIQPPVENLVKWLGEFGLRHIQVTPVDDPMARDFYLPETPLDPSFRYSFSEFSYLSENEMVQGIERLKRSIQDGSVQDVIETCRQRFQEIGGTVFFVSAVKA